VSRSPVYDFNVTLIELSVSKARVLFLPVTNKGLRACAMLVGFAITGVLIVW
jgi:hypothetical protein